MPCLLFRVGLSAAALLLTGGCASDDQVGPAGTEPVVTNGMDVLPDHSLTPQADGELNPIGAAVTANGDPFGIIVTAGELDCLQPLELDIVWDDAGAPVRSVGACLRPATVALFTAWHRFEAEVAGDSSDTEVACIDAALRRVTRAGRADGATYARLLTECGVTTTSAEG